MLLSGCCAGHTLPDRAGFCNRDLWGNSTKVAAGGAAGFSGDWDMCPIGTAPQVVSWRRSGERTPDKDPSKNKEVASMMAMLKKIWNCLKASYLEYVAMLYTVQH